MAHTSKIFNKVPVKIQDLSGFDMSHENLFTATCGTLIPAMVEEVIPGDVFSIGSHMQVKLPPLATDFYGRIDAKLEAFFVPNRLIWAGWQDFITNDPNNRPSIPSYTPASNIPVIQLTDAQMAAGTLADYLGVKKYGNGGASTFNALPFLAYHKIFDDWYRDSNLQNPFFTNGVAANETPNTAGKLAMYMPFNRSATTISGTATGLNGVQIASLNQRNWAKDYYTTCTTRPQSGAASELTFSVDDTTMEGSFSIASLRAANSLQKWLERNNIGGTRYYDQILAHFGVTPSDAHMQRAILLGSNTVPCYINSISQTAASENDGNPFESVGAQYGKATCYGEGRLVDNFKATEHGFIIIMYSLVPHAYYSTGIRRYMNTNARYKSGDYAFPEFANIGDQPVYESEINAKAAQGNVFGYNQRYSEYKYHDDEVHGLFRDGSNLSPFVLQRTFTGNTNLTSAFLQIPTNYLDGVTTTSVGTGGFSAMVDCYFDSKALRTLPEYSLPSLN